ncbi:MAG: hypothetical protein ACYC1Q_01320, partial [Bacteroidia bacterium]
MKKPIFNFKLGTLFLLLFYGSVSGQSNLVLNGDFSSTTCTGCTMTSSNVSDWLVISGSPTISSTKEITLISGSDEIKQNLASTMFDGHKYQLELNVMNSGGTSGGIIVETDGPLGTQQILNWPVTATSLTLLKACFDINDDKTSIRIKAYASGGSPMSLTIDDISIRDIAPVITSDLGNNLCNGQSTLLTLEGVDINYVSWSPSATLSSSNGTSVTATPVATTTYNAMVVTNTGCVVFGSIPINYNGSASPLSVNPAITSSFGSNVCYSQSTTLIVDATNVASVTWSPYATLNSPTGTSVVASPTASTTYHALVIDNNGCPASSSIAIGYNAATPPVADFSFLVGSGDPCTYFGASNNHNAYAEFNDASTVPSGATNTLAWSFDDPGSGSNNTSNYDYEYHDFVDLATSSLQTDFDVSLYVSSSNGCHDEITKQVTVYTRPSAQFTVSNACQTSTGANFTFTADSPLIGAVYDWTYGGSIWTASGYTAVNTISTSYQTLQLKAYTSTCTTTYTKIIRDEVQFPTPTINFPSGKTVCKDGSLTFSEGSGYPSTAYKWYVNGSQCSASGSSSTISSSTGCF